MTDKDKNFDIKKLLKLGKNIVVELDDEVEYIVGDAAVKEMQAGKEKITLIRVIDRTPQLISMQRIKWAISKGGIVDYIDIV